jgi:hypothetical protein
MRRGPWSRSVLIAAALIVLVAPSIVLTSEGAGPVIHAPGRALEWLLLIYMAADNTLGENGEWGNAALMDIDELEDNFPSQGARALVLADLKGDHNTALYDIGRYPEEGVGSPTIPLSNVNSSWSDEIRSSDWQALRDFLIYGLGSSDAAHMMLVIWDHGSGWQAMKAAGPVPPGRSVAQDVTDGGIMDLRELRWALQSADTLAGPLQLDIISFDACYMGTLEVFHQVSPWADICITSEDEQPFYGFNYSFVWRMGSQDVYNPRQLSSSIVSDFAAEYSNAVDYPYSSMTAADLVVVSGDLEHTLEVLARELWGWMYELQVRSMDRFYIIADGAEQVGYSQNDLGDMLRILGTAKLPGNLSALANATRAEYNRMIISELHVAGGRNPHATGATIYFPPDNLTYYDPIYDGSSGYLSLTGVTYWDEMLREMCNPKERMRISVNVTALDPDQIADDLVLTVFNTTTKPFSPIEGATVGIPGLPDMKTAAGGMVEYKDIPPGRYSITASKDMLRARAEAKVLNIPPVIRYSFNHANYVEGLPIIIDASSSYDPDGDDIAFGWDMNVSDGLQYNDSSESHIEFVSYSPIVVQVGLRVSDPLESVFAQIMVQVDNSKPKAMLQVPSSVLEDEVFVADASGSTDTFPDNKSLLYSFELDGSEIGAWSSSPYMEMSIPKRGEHIVKVLVKDDQSAISEMADNIIVFNDPPKANILGPDSASEDESFELVANGTDTPSDIAELIFEWSREETGEILGHGRTYKGSFGDSGIYNISLKVLDDDSFIGLAYKEIRIINVDPIPSFTSPESVYEDEVATLDAGPSYDTPSDMPDLRFGWDMGADGTVDLEGRTANMTYSFPGTYVIRLIVTDDDGSSTSVDRTVLVINKAPKPVLSGPEWADEDEVFTVRILPGSDTSSDESGLVFIWMVDGSATDLRGGEVELSFATQGMHTIDVKAVDDQRDTGNDSIEISVRNIAPIARVVWRSSNLHVGDHLEVSAETSSDTPSDNLTLRFVWSIDGMEVLETKDRTAKFMVDDPGKHFIELKAVDDDGAESKAGPIEFDVREKFDPMPLILVGAAAVLVSAVVTAFVIGRKVRRLPQAVEIEEATPIASEKNGSTMEQMDDPQGIPTPEGLGPPIDPPLPDPPEMAPPLIGEAPRSEPPPPVPIDPEIYD